MTPPKVKANKLQDTRSQRTVKDHEIDAFMFTLAEYETGIMKFDDRLWMAVVRKTTAYQDGRLVFTFRNGAEVEG